MKTGDLTAREDIHEILRGTIRAGLLARYGCAVNVTPPREGGHSLWLYQPAIGACWNSQLGSGGRRLLANLIRRTPVAWRRPLQFVGGTLLCTRVGLRLTSRPEFNLYRSPLEAESTIILVGNRRLRILDLRNRRCLVLAKQGFSADSIRIEVGVRGATAAGPYPWIDNWAEDYRWFEEDLLDALPLPRCPAGWDQGKIAQEVADDLEAWAAPTAQKMSAGEYVQALADGIRDGLGRKVGRYVLAELLSPDWVDSLAHHAQGLEVVETRRTHGDFQPGNILVLGQTRKPLLSDWETSDRRSRWYDRVVFGLRLRLGGAIARRLREFVEGGVSALPAVTEGANRRSAVLALVLLEDFAWLLRESAAGPLHRPASGVFEYARELPLLGPRLEALTARRAA